MRRLVTDFPSRRPEFDHRSLHVAFVGTEWPWGGGHFIRVLRLSLPIIIPPPASYLG
jgi:hypothetical protein